MYNHLCIYTNTVLITNLKIFGLVGVNCSKWLTEEKHLPAYSLSYDQFPDPGVKTAYSGAYPGGGGGFSFWILFFYCLSVFYCILIFAGADTGYLT